jgi:hypothetical protein
MKKVIYFFLLIIGTLQAQSPLCPSTSTNFCCEYVASITINGQTYAGNTGFSGPGYYDYTGTPVPTISAGQQTQISYTVRTNGNYLQYFKLWIDFNGNGDLTDPGELVFSDNATIPSTTQTFNKSFTVPTTVFNGEIYMRFIMVFSSSPTLCGNYSYGNTFDFKSGVAGAIDPFNFSGNIYDSEGNGIQNIPLQVYYKTTVETDYTLYTNLLTNEQGEFEVTTTLNAESYNFKVIIQSIPYTQPSTTDAESFNLKLIQEDFNSKDFYRMDVNGNRLLTISDVYSIYAKINNNISNFQSTDPNYRIFTSTEWSVINSSTSDLTSTYVGAVNIIIENIPNGEIYSFYVVKKGHRN